MHGLIDWKKEGWANEPLNMNDRLGIGIVTWGPERGVYRFSKTIQLSWRKMWLEWRSKSETPYNSVRDASMLYLKRIKVKVQKVRGHTTYGAVQYIPNESLNSERSWIKCHEVLKRSQRGIGINWNENIGIKPWCEHITGHLNGLQDIVTNCKWG